MRTPEKFSMPNHGERIDDYYARIFFERNCRELSEELVFITSLYDVVSRESGSVRYLSLDRLLNREYEYHRTISEALRVATPDGKVFCTFSSVAPSLDGTISLWGFTPDSVQYLLSKQILPESFRIVSFGNVFSGSMLLDGVSADTLSEKELLTPDSFYPIVTGAVITLRPDSK